MDTLFTCITAVLCWVAVSTFAVVPNSVRTAYQKQADSVERNGHKDVDFPTRISGIHSVTRTPSALPLLTRAPADARFPSGNRASAGALVKRDSANSMGRKELSDGGGHTDFLWYTCGDRQCRCQGTRAECIFTGLKYVPKFPPEITSLNFSQSGSQHVHRDYFINITNIKWLNLSHTGIYDFSADALAPLRNLTHLDVTNSFLDCIGLHIFFAIPTLEMLVLKDLPSCDVLEETGLNHPMSRLQELDLGFQRLTKANLSSIRWFTGLKRLTLKSWARWEEEPGLVTNFEVLHQLKNLTYLDLSQNNLSCFDLCIILSTPSLENVVLRDLLGSCDDFCNIGITSLVPKLKVLNVGGSFNKLNLSCLSPFTGLQRLHVDGIEYDKRCPTVTMYSAFNAFRNLSYVDLSNNRLSCDKMITVLGITSLEELVVAGGTLCHLYTPLLPTSAIPSSKIKSINLQRNVFRRFPAFCASNSSPFPSLKKLDLSHCQIELKPKTGDFSCLTSLETLILRGNKIAFNEWFTISKLQSLETLDVSAQKPDFVPMGIFSSSFNNSNLKTLILDDNDIHFKIYEMIDTGLPAVWANLIHLSLANTHWEDVPKWWSEALLGGMTLLKSLSLRSTGLTYISVGMVRNMRSLERIDLSGNSLAVVPDAAIKSLPSLVSIDMSLNKITMVQEQSFPLEVRRRLEQVDLSGNPLECSCQVLWFQQWLLVSPSLFAASSSDYACTNLPGTPPLVTFHKPEQACLFTPETNQFIVATVSLIMIGMSLFTLLYSYRWHLRLVLYEAFRGREDRLQRLRIQHFQYDVFVSYDKDDFPWVRDHLMPTLEGGLGLKLCLHQRDFIPGAAIVDNIMESVESSKKMLMVFSRRFAKSQWCQFELNLCLTHAMDTDDMLVIVLLEDIPSRDLTSAMMAVMKTTTYIEWADGTAARHSFWQRLRLSLDEVLGGGGARK